MKTICRNNHYVPQMYLQQWGTDNRIYEYKLLAPHEKMPIWSHTSIVNTASQPNLYVRVFGGDEYDDFETDFNRRFETPASEPLLKACQEKRMTTNDWDRLCDFITLQFVRTPAFYHKNNEMIRTLFEDSIQEVSKSPLEPNTSPDNDYVGLNHHLIPLSLEVADQHPDENHTLAKVNVVVGKSVWLAVIEHMLKDGSVLRTAIRKLRWSIVSSHEDVIWPTTDDPFVFVNPRGRNLFQVGLNSPGSVVVFPISPRKALIAKSGGRFPPRFSATKDDSIKIKRWIVENAFLSVYSSEEDPEIQMIRPRVVDEKEFQRIQAETSSWHDVYREEEAPLLR